MTLYEIATEYLVLLEMAEDPEVEPEVLQDTMEGIEGEFELKADSYAIVMNELSSQEDKLTKEIERLTARKKAIATNKDRIKKNLEETMRALGKTKFKTEKFSFNIQKNPASLKVDDDLNWDDIPVEFIKYADPQINKTALKDAIKGGAEFTWARLEQSEGLRVR